MILLTGQEERGGVGTGPEVNETVFVIGFLSVAVLLVCLGWREKRRR